MLTAKIENCRSCFGTNLLSVWELANSPYGDLFSTNHERAIGVKEEKLTLVFCRDCTLLQLLEITDIVKTYEDYLYTSSVTHALGSYYGQVTGRLICDYQLRPGSTIVDIGSNDGTFLGNFKELGFNVIGVEPTSSNAERAESRGVRTINRYFDEESVKLILQSNPNPSLISINYTLANIPNLKLFMSQISELMNVSTVLSVITGYHPDQYAVNMFEYINHDHLTYLSVLSLSNLCDLIGLKIIDVNRSEHKGGSIQFLIAKKHSKLQVQSSVTQLKQREKWLNCNSPEFTTELALRIQDIAFQNRILLDSSRSQYVYGVGASISTTYLCNQFEISRDILSLYDDDNNKIGKFAPGTGTEVFPLSTLPRGDSTLSIILAWQHSEKLLDRLKELGHTGRILLPLPRPQIIEF